MENTVNEGAHMQTDPAQGGENGTMAAVLAEALQDAWDEFVADTGCVPDVFRIHGPRTTRVAANFTRGNFVDWVIARVEAAGYRIEEAPRG